MTYIATALVRDGDAWTGDDLDLAAVDDLDGLVDRLREDGELGLLLLEEDDEYVALARVDGDAEPRVFLSDRRVLDGDSQAARLFGEVLDAEAPPAEDDEDDDEESGRPEVQPTGDEELLADLGVDGERLTGLCAEEGMLPSDVIFAVGEAIGAADELERVRGM